MSVNIKALQSLNEVFTRVIHQIFLTPAFSNEAQNEITWAQQKIMILLEENGPMKMSDLARNVSVTMSGATAIVDKMVRADLVKREADPQDRRVIRIDLSSRGRQFIANCMQTQAQCFAEILDHIEPAKQQELLDAFERIHTLLSEIEDSRCRNGKGAGSTRFDRGLGEAQ